MNIQSVGGGCARPWRRVCCGSHEIVAGSQMSSGGRNKAINKTDSGGELRRVGWQIVGSRRTRALGVASDELVRYGGTSVLAETPEIYWRGTFADAGRAVFARGWREADGNGSLVGKSMREGIIVSINNNPSHGNKGRRADEYL